MADRDQDGSFIGQDLLGRLFRLVEGETEAVRQTQNLSRGAHLGTQQRVHFLEHVEGEDGLFDTEVREGPVLQIEIGKLLPQHDLGRDAGHGNIADL